MTTKRKRAFVILLLVLVGLGIGWLVLHGGMERARCQAESMNCCSRIVSICFAARMWANDHEGRLPSDFLSMDRELSSPTVLHCPADQSRPQIDAWANFRETNSSYELAGPGLRDTDTNSVFLRCRVHGYPGYADATVFDGVRRRGKHP